MADYNKDARQRDAWKSTWHVDKQTYDALDSALEEEPKVIERLRALVQRVYNRKD